ncbi:hypothetical protein WAI453_003196 [Rhynchosporium graminicola]|uniref:Uncharacterized protein n=1 Tax=Rhynchosporium graminicola TaxID=2792576 RepID=A0A1E1LFY7_9HELO|nr:uncharacterized protein RCO7_07431 [Rhynchosporium commune]
MPSRSLRKKSLIKVLMKKKPIFKLFDLSFERKKTAFRRLTRLYSIWSKRLQSARLGDYAANGTRGELEDPWEWSTPLTRRPLDYVAAPLRALLPASPIPQTAPLFPGISQTLPTAYFRRLRIFEDEDEDEADTKLKAKAKTKAPAKPTISNQCSYCLEVFIDLELRNNHMCGTPREYKCPYDCSRSGEWGFRTRWEREAHLKKVHRE